MDDVNRFLCFFENVAMGGNDENDRTFELLLYLDRDSVQFLFETFAKVGTLTED